MFWRLCPPRRGWLSVSETYYKIKRSTLDTLANGFQAACELTEPLTPEQMIALLPDMYLDLTKTFPDDPDNTGVSNALERAALWRDIEYTAQGTMYADDEDDAVVNAGDKVRGLWYSSTRGTDDFIGYAVSLYSLMTAINNPRSVLYTRRYSDYFANDEGKNGASNTYGSNCSEYVSWALGLPYLTVTNWLPKLECFVNENGVHDTTYGGLCWDSEAGAIDLDALRTELKLCDVLNSNRNFGGDAGHAVMVTGIRRNRKGVIQEVDISEDWWASMTSSGGVKSFGCIRTTTYTWDKFVADFIDLHGYRAYRYKDLAYTPDAPVLNGIVYSDLCTSRGDRVAIRPDQDIALNIISNADQYAGIVLLKDGNYHSHHEGATDWRLIDPNNQSYPLVTGKYTAILYQSGDDPTAMTLEDATENNSTRFIVVSVEVKQMQVPTSNGDDTYTSVYHYVAESIGGQYPVPVQATAKVESGKTSRVVELKTDEDYDGTGDFEITAIGKTENGDLAIVHVPFETEYGFVIGEIGYDGNPIAKPTLPEDETTEPEEPAEEYTPIEYISFPHDERNVYFDTGIDMLEYDETALDYTWDGVMNKGSNDNTMPHFWGARDHDGTNGDIYSGCAYANPSANKLGMHLGGKWEDTSNTAMNGKVSATTDNRILIEAKNVCPAKATAELYLNGEQLTLKAYTPTKFTHKTTVYLLATHRWKYSNGEFTESVQGTFVGKLYGFKIAETDGDTLRDFKPAIRNSDQAIGLLDTVNNVFYENKGTGTIEAGPVVSA